MLSEFSSGLKCTSRCWVVLTNLPRPPWSECDWDFDWC
ncbi:hypothetical protein SynRS9902_01399 [Synechococcus sp. RS9902]|nr:hypothetical protein SynRS9902_01399 [Synechococcus sp. RS9902]